MPDLPEEAAVADLLRNAEFGFTVGQVIDVYPVRITSAVEAQGSILITAQDPQGGELSGVVAVVPVALPSAQTVQAGDCVHLVAENVFLDAQDPATLRVKATALDIFPCGDVPTPSPNAGADGQGFEFGDDLDNRVDGNSQLIGSLNGQLVSYESWTWRVREIGIGAFEAVLTAEQPQGTGCGW